MSFKGPKVQTDLLKKFFDKCIQIYKYKPVSN